MAFAGARRVALQLYALAGRVGGPYFRNLPVYRKALFQLVATRTSTFQLPAVRTVTFQLPARIVESFTLGA